MSDFGRRWLSSDDSDLGISRELLQSLRDVPGPPEGAMKEEWGRLSITLGAAATTAVVNTGSAAAPFAAAQTASVPTAGAGSASASASAGKLASGQVLKWLVPLALFGGAGAAVVFVAQNEQPQANQSAAIPVTVNLPTPSVQMDQEPPSVTQTSKGLAEGKSEPPAKAPAPSAPREAPRSAASSLEAERRLLERARQLVGSGRPTAALTVLGEYRREHPRPMLGQEREVLTIDALIASSQHAEAGKRARSFLGRFPESPHSSRLRRYVGAVRP